MATDATGTPTSQGIPTFQTNVDAPSGKGFNAAMTIIDGLITSALKTAFKKSGAAIGTRRGLNFVDTGGVTFTVADDAANDQVTVSAAIPTPGMVPIFDVVVGRGQTGDPAAPATVIDSNTILGGNIPQTYKHLKLIVSLQTNDVATAQNLLMRLNNDATAVYGNQYGYDSGTTRTDVLQSGQSAGTIGFVPGAAADAFTFNAVEVLIPDYTATKYRLWTMMGHEWITGSVSGNMFSWQGGGRYTGSTSALTRVQLIVPAGAFIANSRVTLYGMN